MLIYTKSEINPMCPLTLLLCPSKLAVKTTTRIGSTGKSPQVIQRETGSPRNTVQHILKDDRDVQQHSNTDAKKRLAKQLSCSQPFLCV